MKTLNIKNNLPHWHRLTSLAASICLFAGFASLPLRAQDEYIPAGYNEDEWYDPGDWFDGNNIEKDGSDPLIGESSDTYEYDPFDYDPYDYGIDAYDYSYTPVVYDYYWDPVVLKWKPESKNNQATSSQAGNRNQPEGGKKEMATFNGTVDGFRKVQLKNKKGESGDFTFVRISLENGEKRVITLGSKLKIPDIGLNKGDRISVSGQNARMDNQKILVANRITVGDKTFQIQRQNRPDAGQQVTVNGTVKKFAKTSLDGSKEQNLLIRVTLKDGTSNVVDFGKGTTLRDLNVQEGSNVRIQGKKSRVDGKMLIVAQKFSVGASALSDSKSKSSSGD